MTTTPQVHPLCNKFLILIFKRQTMVFKTGLILKIICAKQRTEKESGFWFTDLIKIWPMIS